jgi:hypothetical protein
MLDVLLGTMYIGKLLHYYDVSVNCWLRCFN